MSVSLGRLLSQLLFRPERYTWVAMGSCYGEYYNLGADSMLGQLPSRLSEMTVTISPSSSSSSSSLLLHVNINGLAFNGNVFSGQC